MFQWLPTAASDSGIHVVGFTRNNQLFDAIETSEPHTGMFMADLVSDDVGKIEAKFKCKVDRMGTQVAN